MYFFQKCLHSVLTSKLRVFASKFVINTCVACCRSTFIVNERKGPTLNDYPQFYPQKTLNMYRGKRLKSTCWTLCRKKENLISTARLLSTKALLSTISSLHFKTHFFVKKSTTWKTIAESMFAWYFNAGHRSYGWFFYIICIKYSGACLPF